MNDQLKAENYKVVIVGDTGTGKTNIITKYTNDQFDSISRPTIGVEFFQKTIETVNEEGEKEEIQIQIWDTAGQERFRGMASSYYRKALGVLVIYDVTSRESFMNLDTWMDEIYGYVDQSIEIVLIGNKIDLVEEREVTIEEGTEYSVKNNLLFYETSAKLNSNGTIEKLFEELAVRIKNKEEQKKLGMKEKIEKNMKIGSSEIIDITKEKKQRTCC